LEVIAGQNHKVSRNIDLKYGCLCDGCSFVFRKYDKRQLCNHSSRQSSSSLAGYGTSIPCCCSRGASQWLRTSSITSRKRTPNYLRRARTSFIWSSSVQFAGKMSSCFLTFSWVAFSSCCNPMQRPLRVLRRIDPFAGRQPALRPIRPVQLLRT